LDINALRQQMEDLFEDFFPAAGGARRNSGARGGEQTQSLPLNLAESDEAFTLSAPLPGFQPDDVDITVRGQNVTIRAQHKSAAGERDNLTRREWGQATYQRSFELPAPVDADQATAAFKHGVVSVTLPKAAPSTVTVEDGEQEAEGETPTETQAAPEAAEEAEVPIAEESQEKDKGSFYMAPGRGRRGRRHAGPKASAASDAAPNPEDGVFATTVTDEDSQPKDEGDAAPRANDGAQNTPPEGAVADEQAAGASEAAHQHAEAGVPTSVEEAQAADRDQQATASSNEAGEEPQADEALEAGVEMYAAESEQAAQPPTD
jgi:HSP20 family protein